jgi:L-2-hydroxyglutarate oxidase LhgO
MFEDTSMRPGSDRPDRHRVRLVGVGMDRIEALVIGAGVVGLAVGRALAQAGLETVVVEAASGIGQGISSRNSEVIHAGLYYAPGSLKARLCTRGKAQLYALCASHGVAHRACGKLVVATAPDQHAALAQLERRAQANGVPLEPWSAARVRAVEPALQCTAALWSPTTGIVDSHALMLALQADMEGAGGALALGTQVQAIACRAGRPAVVQGMAGRQPFEIEAQRVVNAAGLQACALARRISGLDPAHVPLARFAKGSYFTLTGRSPFRCLVYPAPVDAWLGVHVTIDLGGQTRFGPDLEWLDVATPEDIDYDVDAARAAAFESAIRRYWPGLPDGALQPGYSGVRPKIHAPGTSAPDFRIDGPAVHGLDGLVNLFGIESPGLTAALAMGEHVVDLLAAG